MNPHGPGGDGRAAGPGPARGAGTGRAAGSGPASLVTATPPLPVGVPVGHRRFRWGRQRHRATVSLPASSSGHPSVSLQEDCPSISPSCDPSPRAPPGPGAQSATAIQALGAGLSLLHSGSPCPKMGTLSMPPPGLEASPSPQLLRPGSAQHAPVLLPLVRTGHVAPPRGVWGMWSRQDHHFQQRGGEQGPSACPCGWTSVCPPMCSQRQRTHTVTQACPSDHLTTRWPPRPTGPCPRHSPQQPVPRPHVSTGQ